MYFSPVQVEPVLHLFPFLSVAFSSREVDERGKNVSSRSLSLSLFVRLLPSAFQIVAVEPERKPKLKTVRDDQLLSL